MVPSSKAHSLKQLNDNDSISDYSSNMLSKIKETNSDDYNFESVVVQKDPRNVIDPTTLKLLEAEKEAKMSL